MSPRREMVYHGANIDRGHRRRGGAPGGGDHCRTAVERRGGGQSLHGCSVGALDRTATTDREIELPFLQQKAGKLLGFGKFDGLSRRAQSPRTGRGMWQQSGWHVLLSQLSPIGRLLESIDADLAEQRATYLGSGERGQLEERLGEGKILLTGLVESLDPLPQRLDRRARVPLQRLDPLLRVLELFESLLHRLNRLPGPIETKL